MCNCTPLAAASYSDSGMPSMKRRHTEFIVEFKPGGADISHELIKVFDEQELGSLICRKSEIDMYASVSDLSFLTSDRRA
ncbi:hypothetical protein BC826DRAFT_1073761, partial [Russula brevipes]